MSNKKNRKGTIMKKLYTTLMIAMMGLMTLSFTSCETDEEIAYDLEGTWVGNMSIADAYGEAYVDSEITFLRYSNSYTEGNGLWADYYGPRDYEVYRFEWYVDFGTIYIRFEDGARVEIRSYSLNSNRLINREYRPGFCSIILSSLSLYPQRTTAKSLFFSSARAESSSGNTILLGSLG